MSGKEQMREQMKALNDLMEYNPCDMPDHVYVGMAGLIRFFISRYKINKQKCADLFGVTPKTIERWRDKHNFPIEDSNGDKCVSVKADKLFKWMQKNEKVFNGK